MTSCRMQVSGVVSHGGKKHSFIQGAKINLQFSASKTGILIADTADVLEVLLPNAVQKYLGFGTTCRHLSGNLSRRNQRSWTVVAKWHDTNFSDIAEPSQTNISCMYPSS